MILSAHGAVAELDKLRFKYENNLELVMYLTEAIDAIEGYYHVHEVEDDDHSPEIDEDRDDGFMYPYQILTYTNALAHVKEVLPKKRAKK